MIPLSGGGSKAVLWKRSRCHIGGKGRLTASRNLLWISCSKAHSFQSNSIFIDCGTRGPFLMLPWHFVAAPQVTGQHHKGVGERTFFLPGLSILQHPYICLG